MNEYDPLTPQEVAERLRVSKNTVYELIKQGKLKSYKVGKKIRVCSKALEDFQNFSSVAERISPSPVEKSSPDQVNGFVICGQDILLDVLARYLEEHPSGCRVFRSHLGSYNGLYALYREEVHATAAHLWDSDTDTYNVPYVRRLLPGIAVSMIHIAQRTQGLFIRKGNPKNITSIEDFLRSDIVMVNREKGSGTRVLLDEYFWHEGKRIENANGYENEVTSHLEAASAVSRGKADMAMGNEKTAMQVKDISFIPVTQEQYHMVILKKNITQYPFKAIVEILNDNVFINEISGLGGYDVHNMGKIIL